MIWKTIFWHFKRSEIKFVPVAFGGRDAWRAPSLWKIEIHFLCGGGVKLEPLWNQRNNSDAVFFSFKKSAVCFAYFRAKSKIQIESQEKLTEDLDSRKTTSKNPQLVGSLIFLSTLARQADDRMIKSHHTHKDERPSEQTTCVLFILLFTPWLRFADGETFPRCEVERGNAQSPVTWPRTRYTHALREVNL